eukprot:4393200-Prymnesium_polylepis.1
MLPKTTSIPRARSRRIPLAATLHRPAASRPATTAGGGLSAHRHEVYARRRPRAVAALVGGALAGFWRRRPRCRRAWRRGRASAARLGGS